MTKGGRRVGEVGDRAATRAKGGAARRARRATSEAAEAAAGMGTDTGRNGSAGSGTAGARARTGTNRSAGSGSAGARARTGTNRSAGSGSAGAGVGTGTNGGGPPGAPPAQAGGAPSAAGARMAALARARLRVRRGVPVVPRVEVEARAAALLRRGPMPLVPLEELAGALTRELGAAAGDVLTLRERLVSRPDLFLVLERAAPIAGAEEWPAAEREAYAAALRAAGWSTGPLVGAAPSACARETAPATPEAHVAQVLAELAVTAAHDEGLRERVTEALPLAEATMRALAEAFRAKREADASGKESSPGGHE